MNDTIQIPGAAPSGRFLLRIDPSLHAALRQAALQAGISLNDFCARRLAFPGTLVAGPAADVVRRAAVVVGASLGGVVAFGSWARGEERESSDVDALVVVHHDLDITRSLYHRWDTEPITWEGHAVEPHFVHLPATGARISGLWAEAAVEGVVLFDPVLTVSRRLVEIRRRIVAGEVVRRYVHGQPYWVEAD
jgi:hypothetical protein